jgi:hypothetical protein
LGPALSVNRNRTGCLVSGPRRGIDRNRLAGRKSGRHYAFPVDFTRHDGVLLVGTPFGWGRNPRTGGAVDLRLNGTRRRISVAVVTDEDGVVENYAVMARDNPQFAKFNKISVDQAGGS